MSPSSLSTSAARQGGWLVLVAALWCQLFVACIYGWRYGEYYDYGWYVPPLFAMFMWRIRGVFEGGRARPISPLLLTLGMFGLGASLFCLRVIERVDPRWTLPIWTQALIVISVTLLAAHQLGGRKALLRTLPIIAFACSAIPLPSVVEKLLVSSLTDGVVSSSAALLQLLGMKVQTFGDRLAFMDEMVEVTEGCSGIRSAQSFLMSSLFFGELMNLRVTRRLVLLGFGLLVAWILNVIRASALTAIQFKSGKEAFDQAHDNAGLIAFIVGSILLLAISSWLGRGKPGAVVRKQVERRTA